MVARGSDAGESGTPTPDGVFDIQVHPPENEHLIVLAFVVPEDGTYSVSGLAVRNVLAWSGGTTLKVFDPSRT